MRGQTPKVQKQDKKKKPKGRAFKRFQYIRRFVNVGACRAACSRGAWLDDISLDDDISLPQLLAPVASPTLLRTSSNIPGTSVALLLM